MPKLINWTIARHPMNWIVVTLMAIIGLFALHFMLQYFRAGVTGHQTNTPATTG